MYNKTLTNRRGDNININADKGRNTLFITIKEDEAPEGALISLNYEEFIKLRQMLAGVFAEMGW